MSDLTRSNQVGRQSGRYFEADALRAERMAKIVFVAGLRGAKLHEAASKLSVQELLDVIESSCVSRAVRVALIYRLSDIDLLVALAAGNSESFVRLDALQRLDVLQQSTPLSRSQLEKLVCCLSDGNLFAATVVLMETAGFDWCARCDECVADAMCFALYNCPGIHEEVVIDDAFAQLAHSRPDLVGSLRACSPERFLPQSLQSPAQTRTITLVDIVRRDDVA